jgi:DHA2 family methylenomycin A resistance protein-like MFS transporter
MTIGALNMTIARPNGRSLILLTMCLGVLVAQIDTSVVNLALKHISADLTANVSQLQWVVDSYNLTYATLLLTGGVLADLYGRRRIFAVGLALFTIGSLICGFAPNVATLIAGRTIAGIGAALEVPTTLAILAAVYPDPDERALPLGIWASCNGLAFIIGPTLGGLLVDHEGWRSIFLLIVPLCVLALGLTWAVVGESAAPKGRQLDLPGQGLAIVALGTLSLAAIEGPSWGLASIWELSTLVVFVAALVAFLRVEAGTVGALMPLDLFKNASFSASIAVAALMTFGMYAMLFLTPLYLQSTRGASAITAGLELLPMSVSFVIVSQLSGRLTKLFGPRVITCAGMAGMGLGMLLMALLLGGNLLSIEAALLVIGIGLGLNTAPIQNVAVTSVPEDRAGTASGLVNTARMVGATIGVAILGLLLGAHPGEGENAIGGYRLAYLIGGTGELVGALIAFAFVSPHSLRVVKR